VTKVPDTQRCSALRRAGTGALTAAVLLVAAQGWAHFGPRPISLQGIQPPAVPGLTDGTDPIVVDEAKAIALGKALFWDTDVGSDGMACASCHFHAGADRRTKNQLSPSGKDPLVPTPDFDSSPSGPLRGPNYTLGPDDFPFYQTSDPFNPIASVTYSSDDVASSAGSFGGDFEAVSPSGSHDACGRAPDPLFHVGAVGTRRVSARNAPSVINAVYSHRQFWDGSANQVFNGSSPWGDRDPDAGVWVETSPGNVEKQRLTLINASLASQALAPPTSSAEMSCGGRRFADIGRKLASRAPLATQAVHWQDSVLGPLSNSTPGNLQPGLSTTYYALVTQAFAPKYWSYAGTGPFGTPSGTDPTPYTQWEANFAMFFALAIQLYERTLVSDESPFDLSATDANGVPIDLSPSAQAGFETFRTAHCNLCHIGPVFTSAALISNATLVQQDPLVFGNETFAVSTSRNVVTRLSVQGGASFIDTGFASTGVTPNDADAGLAGLDPFGNPLSFADQYLELLTGNAAAVVDAVVGEVRPCDLDLPIARDTTSTHPLYFTQVQGVLPQTQGTEDCFAPEGAFVPQPAAALAELQSPGNTRMLSAARNSFKIPTLRNVELTGPYMHNGSMATLEQVVEFYTRGGNYETDGKHFGTVFPQVDLRFDPTLRQGLIDFLRSLTDERVRYERAPFDHPALTIPHGHAGDHIAASPGHPLGTDLALDAQLLIPAVGAAGRETPLQPFEVHLLPEPSPQALGLSGTVTLLLLERRRRRARPPFAR
jgi:cytochrome c peroxidase